MPSKKNNISLAQLEKPFIQIYICFIVVLFGWTASNYFRFPYGLDYGEAPLMDQAMRIENKQLLYKANINEPPYLIANYPPVYPMSVALLNNVFHLSLFQAGRSISIFFTMVCALIIGLLCFRLTNDKLLGVLGAAIFLGNPYVLIWSSIARVDLMALAFSLLGLWAIYQSRNSKYWIIAAGIFFVIAIFTRQTYIVAGPLAGFAWLWYVNRRRASFFILAVAVITLLLFGLINALTHGGFFTNIVVANNNRYELSRLMQMSKQLVTIWSVIIIIAVLTFIIKVRSLIKHKETGERNLNVQGFIVFGLGGYSLGAIISALTIGKVGSDVNYFLEFISICSIWCVIGIDHFIHQKKAIKSLFFAALFLQLIWGSIAGTVLIRGVIIPKWRDLPLYDSVYAQVKNASREGIVLSDDYLDMVVLSGQSIYYQPFEYGQLYHAGLWNPALFVKEIDQGRFSLIIIGGETINKECCWPPSVISAIRNEYIQSRNIFSVILTPKK